MKPTPIGDSRYTTFAAWFQEKGLWRSLLECGPCSLHGPFSRKKPPPREEQPGPGGGLPPQMCSSHTVETSVQDLTAIQPQHERARLRTLLRFHKRVVEGLSMCGVNGYVPHVLRKCRAPAWLARQSSHPVSLVRVYGNNVGNGHHDRDHEKKSESERHGAVRLVSTRTQNTLVFRVM